MPRRKKGFTLIELIVVIIIVGVLAAVAIPIMRDMRARAICAEGIATMGVIRNAMRTYLMERDAIVSDYFLIDDPDLMRQFGLTGDDLQGAYFGKECYRIAWVLGGGSFVACVPEPGTWGGGANTAANAAQTANIVDAPGSRSYLIMYMKTGEIKQSGISRSGYPSV